MNEDNDILQMLRDREDEFYLPLREGGWEKLEAELTPPVARQAVHRRAWVWGGVAAAALLCLMLSIPLFIPTSVETHGRASLPPTSIAPSPEEKALPAQQPQAAIPLKQQRQSIAPLMPELLSLLPLEADTLVPLPEPIAIEEAEPATTRHKDSGPQPDRKPLFDTRLATEPHQKHRTPRWSVGLQGGSNALGGGKGSLFVFDPSFTDPGPDPGTDPPDKPDDPDKQPPTKAAIGGGSSSSGSGDKYYYYRHRLPVTVSFSLRRHLFSRLALETGLSYTYLYSDILEEKEGHAGNQQLHYLGIPLKVSWTFYERKAVSFYATAGGMLEYCLSASNTERDLDIQRWQPSLHAAVGMQVQIVKPWSLYAEPGVSYYYRMNPTGRSYTDTRFETIRMVHPLTFNLQVGIRFTY